MKSCNFWFIVLFVGILSWFDYIFLTTYNEKEVYNYLVKIKDLEDKNKELERELKQYKIKAQ